MYLYFFGFRKMMPAKKKKKVGKKKKIVVTQTSDVGHDGDQSVD